MRLGAGYFTYAGEGIKRLLAVAALVCAIVIIGGGYVITNLVSWRGPMMSYFETPLWALYIVLSVALLFTVGRYILFCLSTFRGNAHFSSQAVTLLGCLVLAFSIRSPNRAEAFPPKKTPIVRELAKTISLRPGSLFRGYASTFTGAANKPEGASWLDLAYYDWAVAVPETGNDHRFVGLWAYNIPTLQEYNQFRSPASYLYFSRLLARPVDQQMRSITIITRPDLEKLKSLGVAYLISDVPFPDLEELAGVELTQSNASPLRLYKLADPNLGQFSPRKSVLVSSAEEALSAIEAVDLRHVVVTDQGLPSLLSEAQDVTLRFYSGSAKVSARSYGTQSVIILPIQFSQCLFITGNSGARLFRANLIQTGVLFSGGLDIDLRLRNEPFTNPRCRLSDLFDMKRFGLSEAALKRPIGK